MAKRIEIGMSYKKNYFKFREGDIDGATECNMFTREEVLSEVNDLLIKILDEMNKEEREVKVK